MLFRSESMDDNIARILNKLKEKGLSDNTLIIFMSDNGGTKSGSNGLLRGYKGNLFEGGIRVPCVAKWPGKISPGIVSHQPCITFDFSMSVARIASATLSHYRSYEGMDILKHIEENQPAIERTLFWRARRGEQTRKAVRDGNLKYIQLNIDGEMEEYLFDLENDPEEKTNLSNSKTDDLNHLKILLDKWEMDVKPVR